MAIQIPEEFSNPNSWGSILNDNWQEIKDRLTGVTQTGITKDEGDFDNRLNVPIYSDDGVAPTETQYFNDVDGKLKYKDAGGTIFSAGLQDGENFDGEGTSEFTDLKSLGVENLNGVINADSFATIDDAFAYIQSNPPNTLFVPEGVFTIQSTDFLGIDITTNEVTIIGSGRGSVIEQPNTGNIAIAVNATDVTIDNLRVTAIDANAIRGDSGADLHVRNCQLELSQDDRVLTSQSLNGTQFRGNQCLNGGTAAGIRLGSDNTLAVGNVVDNEIENVGTNNTVTGNVIQ